MSTQQVNIRIDTVLAAALDRVAREESLDRATAIRRLLEQSIKTWELEHAVLGVQRGREALREKIRAWQPGLVLFAFRAPAVELVGRNVRPGRCGDVEDVPAFLLSGPYASHAETSRIDRELIEQLGLQPSDAAQARTQRVTDNDLERGQIRLPREAKRLQVD